MPSINAFSMVTVVAVVLCVVVGSHAGCQRSNSKNQESLATYSASVLLTDLQSRRRDDLRIAVYYLKSNGAPIEGPRDEQLSEWQLVARQMQSWLAQQKTGTVSALVSEYPGFRAVQGPYYMD